MDVTVKKDAPRQKRLTREHWLAQAIDVLANKGANALTVSGLSGALGVTKGSFYWHFKDRNEFLRQLLDYWLQAFT
ncbi:MAG: TetR/AcrR family transcriptional regulator, partial [Hyphomicrobiales bacterium]|nr:TetR/AcrR family transcriptional regulator [Hyphomicrobiales bacterium]